MSVALARCDDCGRKLVTRADRLVDLAHHAERLAFLLHDDGQPRASAVAFQMSDAARAFAGGRSATH